jgi:hypothetical protein
MKILSRHFDTLSHKATFGSRCRGITPARKLPGPRREAVDGDSRVVVVRPTVAEMAVSRYNTQGTSPIAQAIGVDVAAIAAGLDRSELRRRCAPPSRTASALASRWQVARTPVDEERS